MNFSSPLLSLLSQYELLQHTSQYLRPIDLLALASTSSHFHTLIRKSDNVFSLLKRTCLCSEKGLILRQEFEGPYSIPRNQSRYAPGHRAYDEEIEVRVWNLKCNASDTLPCLKCEINVCEECRYVPRVRDRPHYQSRRRPHNTPNGNHDLICYCGPCDEKVEAGLPMRLEKFCDCDQYMRWICHACKEEEEVENLRYRRERSKMDYQFQGDLAEGMWLDDPNLEMFMRAFWCPCGERAPRNGNIRCSWCKRRHNLNTWRSESTHEIPFFDNDPYYPTVRRN